MPSSFHMLTDNMEKRHGSAQTTMDMKKIDDNMRCSDPVISLKKRIALNSAKPNFQFCNSRKAFIPMSAKAPRSDEAADPFIANHLNSKMRRNFITSTQVARTVNTSSIL